MNRIIRTVRNLLVLYIHSYFPFRVRAVLNEAVCYLCLFWAKRSYFLLRVRAVLSEGIFVRFFRFRKVGNRDSELQIERKAPKHFTWSRTHTSDALWTQSLSCSVCYRDFQFFWKRKNWKNRTTNGLAPRLYYIPRIPQGSSHQNNFNCSSGDVYCLVLLL